MKQRILSLLVLLMAAVSGAWAQQKYNVTFSGFDNASCNTTITDVTLPYSKSFGKTDACSNAYDIDGSSNNEQLVGASFGGDNFTITVKSAFEGTVTVGVGGWTESFDSYSRNITVACVPAAPPFDYELTVEASDHGSGQVKFFIDSKEVEGAYETDEGKTVTVKVTPDEGWWVADPFAVKAEVYRYWEGSRRAQATVPMQRTVDLDYKGKDANDAAIYTFTMPASNVKVKGAYKKISTLYFDPADRTNLMKVNVDDFPVNLDGNDKTVKIDKVEDILEGTEITLTANTGYKFRKVEVKKGVGKTITIGDVELTYADGDNWQTIVDKNSDKIKTIAGGYIVQVAQPAPNQYKYLKVVLSTTKVNPSDPIDPSKNYEWGTIEVYF